jgi:hypothetical protein
MAVETMERVDVPVAGTRLRVEVLFLDLTTCTRCLGADRGSAEELLTGCCQIELDRRGDITSYRSRGGSCDCRTAKAVE